MGTEQLNKGTKFLANLRKEEIIYCKMVHALNLNY